MNIIQAFLDKGILNLPGTGAFHALLKTLIIVVLAQIVVFANKKLSKWAVSKLEGKPSLPESLTGARTRTLASTLRHSLNIGIWSVALAMILSIVGIDIAPLIAGAGIIGLAIGFGAQALVRDLISGLFLLVENNFNIGDTVEIAGKKGIVKAIKLRNTMIVDDKGGMTYIVPNSKVEIISKFEKK
jgi:moderate conductance mechanosensitive channel